MSILATCLFLAASLYWRHEIFAICLPEGSMLAATRDPRSMNTLEYVEWDPVARIEVTSVPGRAPYSGGYSSLSGENRSFLARYRKLITQNNYAFTYGVDYDGRPDSLAGIEETIYASAYYASRVPRPKVAVIGVGGGFDILTGLRLDASLPSVHHNLGTAHRNGLGVFMPTLLDVLKRRSPHLVPWAWGINGAFSVLAPLLAVAAATTFGTSALLLAGIALYLAVAFTFSGGHGPSIGSCLGSECRTSRVAPCGDPPERLA